MYLAGLDSFSGVIIVINTGKFEGVKNRKRVGVISVLLDIVFNVVDLQKK